MVNVTNWRQRFAAKAAEVLAAHADGIFEKIAAKAEAGDLKCLAFLMQQADSHDGSDAPAAATPAPSGKPPAARVAEFIAANGPKKAPAVAAALDVTLALVMRTVEGSDLFEQQADGIHLTGEGWAAVRGRAD
jgi:hypothetical protein